MDALDMLKEVKASKAIAEKAVQEGDATLTKANDTLHVLQSFKSQVHESSEKAHAALQKRPEIEKQIQETEEIILVAEEVMSKFRFLVVNSIEKLIFQALDGANNNAKEARKNAQEAQEKYADQASKVGALFSGNFI